MNIGGGETGGNPNREYVEADQWRKATLAEAVDRMDSKLADDIENQDNSSADNIVKASEADKTTVNKSEESESQQSGSKETGVKVEKTDTEEAAGALDEYGYTKRDSFTSELFKIHITNMHKKFGFKEFKRKLNSLGLKPVKVKSWRRNCFVTFRNEQEREEAITKLHGYIWKGHVLKVVKALPAADPLVKKRKEESDNQNSRKKRKMMDDVSPVERLKNTTSPLWNVPYEDQLKMKESDVKQALRNFLHELDKKCKDMNRWIEQQRQKYDGLPCEFEKILPSPVTEGYRNKCEFTVGPGLDGRESVVGFRYGQYVQGTVHVGSPDEICFLPESMKKVVKAFQKYLDTSQVKAFNPETHHGYWKQLALRTSRLGHVMAMVDFHPQNMTEEAVEEEMTKLKNYFLTGEGSDSGVTSLYYRTHSKNLVHVITGPFTDSPFKQLFGEEHITEYLLGMKFRISPHAFFQVNTVAAEVLYTKIAEWCHATPETIVLDICCGTGTIGQTVAKSVSKVIGIEYNRQAVEDAKVNAGLNGISNVEYHCSKAEEIIGSVTRSIYRDTDVVAIVDPPRGGLHNNVIATIRNCRSIKRLIYVSCNPNGALYNFIDLLRPESKRLSGPRFYPVKAVPVDLFPSTRHCELVILFEREQENVGTAISVMCN